MLGVFDGPEEVGKTTIIENLMKAWDGPSHRVHHIKGDSNPARIENDFEMIESQPSVLWLYDRWWPSELVYRPHDHLTPTLPLNPFMLDELYGARASASGLLFLVTADPKVLVERRRNIKVEDDPIDIDPAHEMQMYEMVCSPRWERVNSMDFDYPGVIWRFKKLESELLKRPRRSLVDTAMVDVTMKMPGGPDCS